MQIKNWDRIKPTTLLLITWDDILSDASWLTDEKAQSMSPVLCKNVGWFLNHDKLNIRIFDSVASDGNKSCTVIPKGVIRDVKEIKYKR